MRIKRMAPIIFGVASIGLLGLTIYETAKAAVNIDRKLENPKYDVYTNAEIVKETLPDAIPAIISAAATVACIITGNVISYKYTTELIGVLSAVKEGYRAYSNGVRQECRKVDQKARETAFKERTEASLEGLNGEMRWFDKFSGRFFISKVEDVIQAEYHFNRNFILRGYATLNEFYEFLDEPKVTLGDDVGWSEEQEPFYGYRWIDFDHTPKVDKDGDYIQISFPFPPVPDFRGDCY